METQCENQKIINPSTPTSCPPAKTVLKLYKLSKLVKISDLDLSKAFNKNPSPEKPE